jgi:hypothetical protein
MIVRMLSAAALVLLLCGCSTTVAVQARFPANAPPAASLRKVAVADFNRPEGDHFAFAMENMLASAVFDGQRYFTMMDTGRRGAGGDGVSAAQYGRSIGADGVYYGQMQSAYFNNFPWEDRETRCVKKDENGKCIKKDTFVRPCVRRVFTMEVYPSLVNVRTGQVVYSSRKNAGSETSWCRGDMQPIDDDTMIDGAINTIVGQIRPDIAPYNTVLQATIIEKTDGLSEVDAKTFAAAVKAAGKGDLSGACRSWDELRRSYPNHPWTIYNIGVCAEANGDFNGALSHYEQARSLAGQPNTDVNESIDRVRGLISARDELRAAQKKAKPKK